MMNFKNMKIAITDETHLKAVCDVLESMGYNKDISPIFGQIKYVYTHKAGYYDLFLGDYVPFPIYTLTDLLKVRDEMIHRSMK